MYLDNCNNIRGRLVLCVYSTICCTFRNFLPAFRIREQCFTTFEADQLIVPFTGNYTIHYTPNTNDSK